MVTLHMEIGLENILHAHTSFFHFIEIFIRASFNNFPFPDFGKRQFQKLTDGELLFIDVMGNTGNYFILMDI